jgi:hypothetical protein
MEPNMTSDVKTPGGAAACGLPAPLAQCNVAAALPTRPEAARPVYSHGAAGRSSAATILEKKIALVVFSTVTPFLEELPACLAYSSLLL